MKPLDAFHNLLLRTVTHNAPNRPGALVEKCDRETREALTELTSDDLARVRVDFSNRTVSAKHGPAPSGYRQP